MRIKIWIDLKKKDFNLFFSHISFSSSRHSFITMFFVFFRLFSSSSSSELLAMKSSILSFLCSYVLFFFILEKRDITLGVCIPPWVNFRLLECFMLKRDFF